MNRFLLKTFSLGVLGLVSLAATPSRAGYSFDVPDVEVQYLTQDDQPIAGMATRQIHLSYKREFRFFGCGGHGFSLPLPRRCWFSYDLTKTNSVGNYFSSDLAGVAKIPGLKKVADTSAKFKGAIYWLHMAACVVSDKCAKGSYLCPSELGHSSNEPNWKHKIAQRDHLYFGFSGCKVSVGIPESDKIEFNYSGNQRLICKFPMTKAEFDGIVEKAGPDQCWTPGAKQ